MPIRFQEIEEEFHHHQQNTHRHAEEEHGRPQTYPSRPPQRRPKTTTESSTRKLLCIFFKCIIMGFVLSLFLLFIGFAALVLLHFLLATTAGRRRRRRHHHHQQYPQLPTDPTPGSYTREDLQELLPHLSYAASAQTARDCAICLESFKEGDLCRKLPDCRHLFHVNCLDTWLTKVPNCPICRTRVRLDSGGSGSMNSDDEWHVWWPVAFEDGNVAV